MSRKVRTSHDKAAGALAGVTVLVVEDDFYQATDTREAFELAGAVVIGPFSTVAAATKAVAQTPPDGAVLDIDLGGGPEFDLARDLKRRGIPTLFVSGHPASVLPADLSDLPHLEKPAERPAIVKALREIMMANGPRDRLEPN